ncbi:MAG: hypothetical protein CMQ60_00115 [Gammaproteobacteria bacterium]|nr:hypothetical protein [Gammaproteobacteria bacterium]|tara:strand:- start:1388 stop:1783 length:396 start_codon:yes stop_codon:yes gene_type:complete
MTKILDKKNNLLAIVHRSADFDNGKKFYTNNHDEMQFGSFQLKKNEVIEKHIHYPQTRSTKFTYEGLVVIDGKLQVNIYDLQLEKINEVILNSGDAILLISGGHGIKTLQQTKFLEFKQGPYNELKDKEHF